MTVSSSFGCESSWMSNEFILDRLMGGQWPNNFSHEYGIC